MQLNFLIIIGSFALVLLLGVAQTIADESKLGAFNALNAPLKSNDGRQSVVGEYIEDELKFNLSRHEIRKHIATVPTYESNAAPMTEQRLEFDVMVMEEVAGKLDSFMKKMTDRKRKVPILVDGAKFAVEVKSMADKFETKLNVLKKDKENRIAVEDRFTESMTEFISTIIGARSTLKLTNEQVYRRCVVILETAKALVAASPVGLYLDWTQMSIDGTLLRDYSAPIIQWMRDKSFVMRKVLGIARTLTQWLASRAKLYSRQLLQNQNKSAHQLGSRANSIQMEQI